MLINLLRLPLPPPSPGDVLEEEMRETDECDMEEFGTSSLDLKELHTSPEN